LSEIRNPGYTAICPVCIKRYNHLEDNRGWIDIVACAKCGSNRPLNPHADRYDSKPGGGADTGLEKNKRLMRRLPRRILNGLIHIEKHGCHMPGLCKLDRHYLVSKGLIESIKGVLYCTPLGTKILFAENQIIPKDKAN